MTDTIAYTVVWVFVALGCLYTVYTIHPPSKLWVALTLILATVAAPVYLYQPVQDSLGFAVKVEEQTEDLFISYTVDADQKWIYVWVQDVETLEPRAYKIPYTKEDEEKIAEGAEESGEGVPLIITIPGESRPGDQESNVANEIQFDNIPVPPGEGKEQ